MRPLALGLRAPYRLKRTIALLAQATLNLDFTRGGPLDSRVTFSRESGGTSFRPVGRGTLVNQLLWSNDFSNVAWSKRGTLALAPNYAQGLTRVYGLDAGIAGDLYQLQSGVYTDLGAYTPALMLAQDPACPAGVLTIANPQTAARGVWQINLALLPTTPTLVTKGHPAVTVEIEFSGSGTSGGMHFKKGGGSGTVSVLVGTVGAFIGVVTIQQILDNGGIPLTFTAADNLLRLDRPGDPIQLVTVPAHVPRFDYDPVSLRCKGLLVEEQRTNLVTHSHEFDNAAWSKSAATVVPNAAIAPDGTLTADKIIATSANNQHYVFGGGASIAANSTGTLSICAKAAEQNSIAFSASGSGAFTAIFDLAAGTVTYQAGGTAGMTALGNGWYRCSFTCTTTAFAFVPYLFPGTSNSYAGDGVSGVYVWLGQHEVGAFPTSSIPTSGAAATRAAEAATLNTLAPWYVAGGTLFAEFTHTDTSLADRVVLSLHSTSWVNNAMHVRTFCSSAVVAGYNGATNDVSMSLGVARVSNKVAVASANNDFASCLNGGAVAVDNSGTVPPVSMLAIGCSSSGGGNSRNGHIRRVAYWPRRMSNLDLIGLTR